MCQEARQRPLPSRRRVEENMHTGIHTAHLCVQKLNEQEPTSQLPTAHRQIGLRERTLSTAPTHYGLAFSVWLALKTAESLEAIEWVWGRIRESIPAVERCVWVEMGWRWEDSRPCQASFRYARTPSQGSKHAPLPV